MVLAPGKPGIKRGYAVIGGTDMKVDGLEKVTGRTRYADDLSFPHMLYGKLLRSPHAHARIKSIDVSKAAAMPGVKCILTGKDLPVPFGILPVSEDEHALAVDKVRYVGDPVAAVAATDPWTAEKACKAIAVEYEVLDSYMSIAESLAQQGEPIHTYTKRGNIAKEVPLEFGDVEQGFAEADYIREDVFFYEGNTHLPLEEHACVATPDGPDKVTLYSATQTPHYAHRLLAKVLGIPAAQIRVVAQPVGGGFGGKTEPFTHEFVACKMAMQTGRPIKFTFTREEVFYAHRGRHPVLMWVKTGFKKDGKITGMHFRSFLDGGAFGSYGVASTYYTGVLQTCSYKIPHYRFEGVRLFTNKPACGPKRGHGTPQPRTVIETHLDKAAEELGLDPVDIRLVNAVEPFSKTVNHFRITSCGLKECIETVAEAADFRKKFRQLPAGKGIGLAASCYITGAGTPLYWNDGPHSEVIVKIGRGGDVQCLNGATDIGQGANTMHATIVAEVLGLKPGDIWVINADSATTPVDLGSYSSRVTFMSGNAAVQAAQRMRDLLAMAAATQFETTPDRVEFKNRTVYNKDNPEQSMTWQEVCTRAEEIHGTLVTAGSYRPPELKAPYKGGTIGITPTYSYSAAVVQLDVDPETGTVDVQKIWVAHDVGYPINTTLALGQVEGSVYMGLGEALMEEMAYRKRQHKIPSLLDYKSLTAKDMPPVETYLICTHDPEGPFGAKECGQGPLLPIMPAVLNAVYDAVGVRIDEVPCSPDKVLKALEEKAKGRPGRYGPKGIPDHTLTTQWVKAPRPAEWENGGEGKLR